MRARFVLVGMLAAGCGDNLPCAARDCLPACEAGPAGRWSRVESPSPPARRDAVATYDPLRDRVVMFGGRDDSGNLDDTWEWDGARWARVTLPVSPSARHGAAMAFDHRRGTSVLFGGRTEAGVDGEIWEYADQIWTLRAPTPLPGARFAHAMAFDEVRQKIVMTGGSDIAHHLVGTFLWNGDEWQKVFDIPRRNAGHRTIHDEARHRVVMIGGTTDPGVPATDDAFAIGPTGWSALPESGSPRVGAGATFDLVSEQVVVFGGSHAGEPATAQPTGLAWNGTAWSSIDDRGAPPATVGTVVAADGDGVVVFGGQEADLALSDETFVWTATCLPLL